MRLGIASFTHESNTFATTPTTLADFQVDLGQAVIERYGNTFHEVAGFIAGADEFDYALEPLWAANATPAGPLTAETFETLADQLLTSLKQALPLDGLLLALHGAMVAENYPHGDAEIARRVRELVGPNFPLVVTHDYHGNVPADLVANVNALVIYKTTPHIDQRERGLQAASILSRAVRAEIKPVSAIVKPEVLFNIVYHNTSLPPMQPLMQAAIELEQQPGILACSIAAGYQYADVPAMGPSIVVVTDNDLALARQEAERLGQKMWAVRDQLKPNILQPDAAVQRAMASLRTPVALFDLGDNIGGGSAGDATTLLKALLDHKAEGWVMTLYDPEAVEQCLEAGLNATLSLQVGGKTDDMHGPPVAVTGRVRTLHNGFYMETERRHGGGRYFNQGLTAVLEIGRKTPESGGILILNSQRSYPNSIHQITSVGIQPHQHRILVAKGAVAPRAAYEPVCAEIIEVDTPGATAINRPPLDYHQARKSLYEWQ